MLPESAHTEFEFERIAASNLNKIANSVAKIGYSDGITEGRESVFQKGFDLGYADGLQVGFQITKFKIFADIMKNTSFEANDYLQYEIDLVNSLCILNAKNQQHFKMVDNLKTPVEEITKIQSLYTRELLENLKSKCPIICSFVFNADN